ncbi:MAG: type II toxin-antitoxin system HicA family toxin [Xanthobacteraceae bacterium]
MADLYRDLVRILQANSCYLVRKGKGSHEIWYSPVTKRNVTCRGPRNRVTRQMMCFSKPV